MTYVNKDGKATIVFHKMFALICWLQFVALSYAASDVIVGTEKNFNSEVMKYPGVVIVEFFAPWCGHCKSLAPEFEKAASTLKGVVKLVAVDASDESNKSLAAKYGVQGFPTLKVFNADKKSPSDYQGARTADAIISEGMKNVNQLVKDRKKGGGAANSGSNSKSSSSTSGSKKKESNSNRGSAVVELTDDNFQSLVMDSTDVWLVEFFAPWCGHCQKLAPEWEDAAKDLKGQVKLGAVDATIHSAIAQKYGVKGYPTIKVFKGGIKKKATDYNGPREAAGIIQYALQTLEETGVVPKIAQITNNEVFEQLCLQTGKICVIMFVPHIYDTTAKERTKLIDQYTTISKSFRGKPLLFGWSEGGVQESLEKRLEINAVYPSIALLSGERKIYNVQRVSWSEKNVQSFINGVLSRAEKNLKLVDDALPVVTSVSEWDGKDAVPVSEEPPLDADWNTAD